MISRAATHFTVFQPGSEAPVNWQLLMLVSLLLITFLEASRFAQENNMLFYETSALTGECVDEVFIKCATTIVNKIEQGHIDPETIVKRPELKDDPPASSQCPC